MKLSEAGLLGHMVVEQGSGKLMSNNKACFLGGALLAIGVIPLGNLSIEEEVVAYERLYEEWPILDAWVYDTVVPIHSGTLRPVMTIIWDLNDKLHWGRPQIAAWVAKIEAQVIAVCLTPTKPTEYLLVEQEIRVEDTCVVACVTT